MHRTSTKMVSLTRSKQNKQVEKMPERKLELVKTPVAVGRSMTEDEYSPIQIRCTQDGGDDELDVVWDCSSPQSRVKKVYNKQRKRPLSNISPQVPRKLIPKHNLIPQFTSLKAELEKLNRHSEQINTSATDFLNVSPELIEIPPVENTVPQRLEPSDPFGDDSFDEDLIKCSQQVEASITKPQPKKLEFLINNHNIADDSFDAMLTEFTDDDIARLSQENEKTPVKNTPSRKFYRTNSTPVHSPRIECVSVANCSTPVRSDRFLRTKSANDCSMFQSPEKTPTKTCSPEEIEKKRQEAKARLELKKFQNEIEKKRLEALEKLKKKKIQRKIP